MFIKYSTIFRRNVILSLMGFLPVILSLLHGQALSRSDMNSLVSESFVTPEVKHLSSNPDLDDYVRFALQHNPTVQATYAKWEAAIEKIVVAKSLPDPRLDFGYFLEHVETKVGPQEYKIGLKQMIPWFGKLRLQGDIQALHAEAYFQQLQSAINDLYYKIRTVTYEVYYLDKSVDITRQNINLVQNWEVVVGNKYKTAMVGHPDLIKTQIERIKLQDDLLTLADKYGPLVETMRALLNIDTLSTVYSLDTLTFSAPQFSRQELQQIMLNNNPDFRGLNLTHQASSLSVKRAKLNYYPDLGIGIDYIETGSSPKDPLIGMISLSFPLWFKKQKADISAARYIHRSIEEKVLEAENRLQVDFAKIWFELEDAQRKMVLYTDNLIPKSLESLRASEKAYIADKADFLNLIDAQRLYLKFLLEYERSLVRYVTAYAKLENLTGRKL